MQLISDIINELVDTGRSISSPLLKTKVLASRLKNQELLSWVNSELDGYKGSDSLPDYRRFSAVLTGTYINGNYKFNNQPIATIGLNDNLAKSFHSANFLEGVATLEQLNQSKEGICMELSAEYVHLLEMNLVKRGNPYLQILNARKNIPAGALTQVLASIRSKLLDFMLRVDEEFGSITNIEDLRRQNERLVTIMNNTIVNNGSGNIVNTGNKAHINATINISQGDKNTLSTTLSQNGVGKEDINELLSVVDIDQHDQTKKTFGPKVNAWIGKMLGKALNGSWEISVGAAGGLLTEVIKGYLGM